MSARVHLVLIASLCLLAAGCASLPTDRVVEVLTDRVEAPSPSHRGLSASQATDLFRGVAGRLGYVIDGPHLDPRTPMDVEYGAHSIPKTGDKMVFLTLMIDAEHISLLGTMYATTKEFAAAQESVKPFREALDEQNIRYTVATRASWFWGP
jgi:hypothetical protein